MNGPNTFKEALIAEAIGDLARLLDRVDGELDVVDRVEVKARDADEPAGEEADAFAQHGQHRFDMHDLGFGHGKVIG